MTALRRGFTLIEILVVITIIGLLFTVGVAAVQNAREAGRVTKCQANLRDIGQSMTLYVTQRNKGRWPKEPGMRFLLTLHKHNQISGKNSEVFLCPNTADRNDEGVDGEPGSSYADWENLDSGTISYAGRDTDAYPLRGSGSGEEVIAADDNEFGPNHKTITNYLYADGSVYAFDIEIDGEQLLEQEPTLRDSGLPIGPDSPVERFQVLRVD